MSPEFSASDYWENTNSFLGANGDDIDKYYLAGTAYPAFEVNVKFCISMFPADDQCENVRPVIFSENHRRESVFLRLVYENKFDREELQATYPGNIDDMLAGVKKAFNAGEPICAISYGTHKKTGEKIICIHAIHGLSPARVLFLAETQSEIELFGGRIQLGEF